MFSRGLYCLIAGAALFAASEPALAGCVGVPASTDTLSNFQSDPGNWLAKEGSGSIASDIQGISVAASSNPDTSAPAGERYNKFGAALHTMLNGASGEQARALGSALGTQARGCGKTADDAEFLTALQTAVAGTSADTAYGQALHEPQTGAVGAGGGGTGVGGQTGAGGGNGSNTGGTGPGNFGTPTLAENFSANGQSSNGTLGSNSSTTTTTGGTATTNQ